MLSSELTNKRATAAERVKQSEEEATKLRNRLEFVVSEDKDDGEIERMRENLRRETDRAQAEVKTIRQTIDEGVRDNDKDEREAKVLAAKIGSLHLRAT